MLYDDYPYVSGDTDEETACQHDEDAELAFPTSQGRITTTVGDAVNQLKDGPMTVALNALSPAFRFYKEGILTSKDNCALAINHTLVAVGFGEEESSTVTRRRLRCRRSTRYEAWRRRCRVRGEFYSRGRCCGYVTQTKRVPGQLYWKLQNSWGTEWGQDGFIFL